MPGAVAYVVTTITPEWVGPPGDTTERCFAMTVGSGIADRQDERPRRFRQFDPMQQLMLSFSVAARLADGTLGVLSKV